MWLLGTLFYELLILSSFKGHLGKNQTLNGNALEGKLEELTFWVPEFIYEFLEEDLCKKTEKKTTQCHVLFKDLYIFRWYTFRLFSSVWSMVGK